VLEVSLGMLHLHVCMGVESDKNKFVRVCTCEFVISSLFVVLVVFCMCMFVCLDRQYCIAYLQVVVDLPQALVVSPTAWHYFVVDKSFESCINHTTHQCFVSCGWEHIDITLDTMLSITKLRNFPFAPDTRCARIV